VEKIVQQGIIDPLGELNGRNTDRIPPTCPSDRKKHWPIYLKESIISDIFSNNIRKSEVDKTTSNENREK